MLRQYLSLLKLKRSKFVENFAALFSFTSFAENIQLQKENDIHLKPI